MDKENFQPQKDERPIMIISGIWSLYFILVGFCFYLLFLHRISIFTAIISTVIVTLFHIKRFAILNKIKNVQKIQINNSSISIDNKEIKFSDITDFRTKSYKPHVIFFLNNRMIIFQQTDFLLKTKFQEIHFSVIGSEKAELIKDLLSKIINEN